MSSDQSSTNSTARIEGWIDAINAGDAKARDLLLGYSRERFVKIAHRCLGGRGRVFDTEDVVHQAFQAILEGWDRFWGEQAAEQTGRFLIETVAEYFRRSSRIIRDALCELFRKEFGRKKPDGEFARPPVVHFGQASTDGQNAWQAREADSTYDAQHLAFWSDVHAAANDLDSRLRDVVDLVWYHDLTQAEAARVLGLPENTVNSRWQAARLELMRLLGSDPFTVSQ